MIQNQDDIEEKKVEMEGAKDCYFKILVDGPNFVMRSFRVVSGGHTPLHEHPWEHENYILKGKGVVRIGDDKHEVSQGDTFLIPGNTLHTFTNPNEEDFEMICLIPKDVTYD